MCEYRLKGLAQSAGPHSDNIFRVGPVGAQAVARELVARYAMHLNANPHIAAAFDHSRLPNNADSLLIG